jgi:cytochrome P450 family 3 subfamily A
VKDHYIGSIPIKKGTLIGVNVRANHFKEEFYSNPLEFNPERWSVRDPSKTEPFSFFPFSFGKRNCIGQHLSLLESKIAVVCLLKRYSRITLEKPNFKKYLRSFYGAEQMTTTFHKHQNDL